MQGAGGEVQIELYIRDFNCQRFCGHLDSGTDPGINYEGQVGVQKSMNIITMGERGCTRVEHYVMNCTKGVHVPPMHPLDPLL